MDLMFAQILEKRVGVLGTSAGGINFNVSLGREEITSRVNAFFNIVSGASLCKLLANAGEKGLKNLREQRFEKFKIKSMKEYEDKLCGAFNWEIPKVAPKNVKIASIISLKDDTVSTKFQIEMVEDFKPLFVVESNFNHFYTVVTSYLFHKKKIFKFFEDHV